MLRHLTFVASLFILVACTLPEPESSSSKVQYNEQPQPSNLLVEDNIHPLNVHTETPRLSWHANVKAQEAFQIQVATSRDKLISGLPDLWDSEKVISSISVNVPYQGTALEANSKAVWRVRVWPKGAEQPGEWSTPSTWEMGLLNKSDWRAKWLQVKQRDIAQVTKDRMDWIKYAANVHPNITEKLTETAFSKQLSVVEQLKQQPTASLFRHSFTTETGKKIAGAKLHSTAGG